MKLASTNCHNGKVLLENYELDRTGQEEMDRLEELRRNVTRMAALVVFYETTQKQIRLGSTNEQGFFTLYESPPPAPPGDLNMDGVIARDRGLRDYYQEEADKLIEEYSVCFADRVDETVCGLSANEARSQLAHS